MFLAYRTFIVFILKILTAGINFSLQIVLARCLGIDEYGELVMFLTIANICSVIPLLGMNTALIREMASSNNMAYRKWIFHFSEKVLICLAILSMIIWFFISSKILFFYSVSVNTMIFIPIYFSFFALSTLISGVFQGEQKNILNDSITTFLSAARIIWIYIEIYNGIERIIIIYIFIEVFGCIIKCIIAENDYKRVSNIYIPKWEEKIKFLRYCVPLFFTSSIGILQTNLHRVIVFALLNNYSVGVVKVCETYASALGLFIAPFVTFWPVMSKYYSEGKIHEIRNLFQQGSIIVTAFIMPAFIVMVSCNMELIKLFNLNVSDSPEIGLVLCIFCLGVIYDAIIGPAGALLNMTKYSYITFYNSIGLLCCTVVFSFTFIPYTGILGAAIAATLSHVVINTLNAYQNYHFFNIFPYGKYQIELIALGFPIYFFLVLFDDYFNIGGWLHIIYATSMSYFIYTIFYFLRYRKNLKMFNSIRFI